MLGLTHNVFLDGGSTTTASVCDPINVDPTNSLVRWYKVKTGIKADENASGALSPVFDENMNDGDFVTGWQDQTGNANLVQTTSADKPHWKLGENAVEFDNVADMTFTSLEISGDTDFTIVMRIKPKAFGTDVLIGNSSTDFLRFNGSNANFRSKIGGSGNNDFNDGSNTVSDSVYSTIMYIRSGGDTGTLNLYVKASDVDEEVNWAEGHGNTDADEFTLSMVGAEANDTKELNAYIKDILIYSGTALSSDQRLCIYDYLEQQPY